MSIPAEAWYAASTSSGAMSGGGGESAAAVGEGGGEGGAAFDYAGIRNSEGHPQASMIPSSVPSGMLLDGVVPTPLTPVSQPEAEEEEDGSKRSGQLRGYGQKELDGGAGGAGEGEATVVMMEGAAATEVQHIPVAEMKDQAPTFVPVMVPLSQPPSQADAAPPETADDTANATATTKVEQEHREQEAEQEEQQQPARRRPGRPGKERIRRIHLPVRPGMDQLSDSEGSGSEWGDPTEEDLAKLPPGYSGRRRIKKPTDGSIKPSYYYPTEGSTRGVPVFEPTYEEFKDFNAFINKIDNYGMRSGIVKVVPPKEWHQSLASVSQPLKDTLIRDAIEQNFMGSSGLFKQSNIASRRLYNVKQWKELCESDKYRTPDFFGANKKKEGDDETNSNRGDEEATSSRGGVAPAKKPRRAAGAGAGAKAGSKAKADASGSGSIASTSVQSTPASTPAPSDRLSVRAAALMKARAAKKKRGNKGRPQQQKKKQQQQQQQQQKEITPAPSLSSELSSLGPDDDDDDGAHGEEDAEGEEDEVDHAHEHEAMDQDQDHDPQHEHDQQETVDNDLEEQQEKDLDGAVDEDDKADMQTDAPAEQTVAEAKVESNPSEAQEETMESEVKVERDDIVPESVVVEQEEAKAKEEEGTVTVDSHAPPTPAASTPNGAEEMSTAQAEAVQAGGASSSEGLPTGTADSAVDSKDCAIPAANSATADASATSATVTATSTETVAGTSAVPATPTKASDDAASAPQTDKSDAKTINADASSKKRRRGREEHQDNWDEEWGKFDYASLPHGAKPEDYTIEECRKIEKHYWRNFTFGAPPMYGADGSGSLFDESTKEWNVAALDDLLMRINPHMSMPGVNTPYLYFGMWRATFSWHVEDADLYSINHLHFGAPKFWYSVPQAHAEHFERVMASYFQRDRQKCPEFLRHKSYLVSPGKLAKDGIPLNRVVQFPGEIILTYPYGYHSGFNIGFNCAESINFATEGWLDIGRKAQACTCVSDSVRIDVDKWLDEAREDAEKIRSDPIYAEQRRQERQLAVVIPQHEAKRRRIMGPDYVERKPKAAPQPGKQPKAVKAREAPNKGNNNKENISKTVTASGANKEQAATTSVATPSGPASSSVLPAAATGNAAPVLGASHSTTSNIPVQLPMIADSDAKAAALLKQMPPPAAAAAAKPVKPVKPVGITFPCALCPEQSTEGLVQISTAGTKQKNKILHAHRICVTCTPTTYVAPDPVTGAEMVFGYDRIEPARWNLKCGLCPEKHGTKIQCTKSHKCVRAFHATCALKEDSGVVLDAVVGGRSILNPTDDNQHPPSTSDDGHLSILVACRQHNPAWMQALIEKRKHELSDRVAQTPVGTQIQIRATTGIYRVTILGHRPEQGAVEIAFGDGTRALCKHGAIMWPEEAAKLQPKPRAPKKPKQPKADPRTGVAEKAHPVTAGISAQTSQQPIQQFANSTHQMPTYSQGWAPSQPQQYHAPSGFYGQMGGYPGQQQPTYHAPIAQNGYQAQAMYPHQGHMQLQGQAQYQQQQPQQQQSVHLQPHPVQPQQNSYIQQDSPPGSHFYPSQNSSFQQRPAGTSPTYPSSIPIATLPQQSPVNALPAGFVPQPIPYYNGKGMPYKQ